METIMKFKIQTFTNQPALLKSLTCINDNVNFDFATSKIKIQRQGKDFYQLGDLNLALRSLDDYEPWRFYESKDDQRFTTCPLKIKRQWIVKKDRVLFNVDILNPTEKNYEIGGLGMPMIFNQVFTNNTLDESHNNCSFIDPYVGLDNGYLQVNRLNGKSPSLLVIPQPGSQFEAYRPLTRDHTKRDVFFEGFYEWTIFSKAYYRTIWNNKQQWNNATSIHIAPKHKLHFGLQMIGIPNQKAINSTLADNHIPSVEAIPGYVIHGNENIKLFINSTKKIAKLQTWPQNSVAIADIKPNQLYQLNRLNNAYGPVRLTIKFADETKQTVHLFVTNSAQKSVQKLADFHMQKQWLGAKDDFGRTHSFITYDRDNHDKVLTEERSFISGDSDEVGAGPNLLMAMKNLLMPNAKEIKRLEQYVDDVLVKSLQNSDYSIHASLYSSDQNGVYSWNKKRSAETWRAYNYPHQAAIYWVMYRLARNYTNLVTNHNWQWYLKRAYNTVMAMHKFCGKDVFLDLEQYGLMVGSVHLWILQDLINEKWSEEAINFKKYMHFRYQIWDKLQYPYGSEMPWDSTGQEEVYTWCNYFNDSKKALQTVRAIMAYTPSLPHWGYNGAARRYFDSFVYGKWYKISREFNHYGSSLNAIPILDYYREHNSNDLYQLQVGYAAATSPLTSINPQGFGSMAFLADPQIMDFEPYTGDFGQAFYGYAHEAGQYAYYDSEKGWLSFGGNVDYHKQDLVLTPQDAFRKRIFIHQANTDLNIICETMPIKKVIYSPLTQTVKVYLDHQNVEMPNKLRIKTSANLTNVEKAPFIRNAFEFDPQTEIVTFQMK